ncbi:hypothetical protein ABTY20_06505 [Streptomyces sp. NPDC126497]|uniref:hypothetical protein n=1 Tax=Streptomyces sp. NPDC126497 TaxID=3155313 RepID=UPI003329DFB3
MTESTAGPGVGVTRRLVLADIAHQYSVAPTEGAPTVVAELAPEAGNGTRAMELLRQEDTTAQAISLIDDAGAARPLPRPAEPLTTWACTRFPEEFTAYLSGALPPSAGPAGSPLAALAPLMLLRTHTAADRPCTEVLMCARVRTIGTLFVRAARFHHAADAGLPEIVAEALRHRTALQDHLRIENNAYLPYEKGVEIEQKVTLLDDASIWSLSKDIWTSVENGGFPGFVTDPGYELTRWHFVQHNYEVVAPSEAAGHYAFQENPDGRYQLKMKTFPADALRRTEIFRKGVEVPDQNFDEYLAREFPGLTFRRLPSFRRTRFDVNVQSLATGHCFGIESDETTVDGPDGRKLRQVEMEYLETRWHEGMDASSIDDELRRLTDLVEAFLAKDGIAAERNFYSKLSFLKDCTADAAAAVPS